MRFPMKALLSMYFAVVGLSCVSLPVYGQGLVQPPASRAEQALDESAQQGRFTFVVFYKADDAATQAMVRAVKKGIAAKGENAATLLVNVASPAEQKLVDKLGIRRAPMPLCVAFAPNGVVTALHRKAPSQIEVAKAFVTPTMMSCMKAMQAGKIVLICIQVPPHTAAPSAVEEFELSPEFKGRTATVTLDTQDPLETEFLSQLKLDAANTEGIATVMLAPPGVLVGKFKPEASLEEMAAELHAAGKCCNDPNCKHHKAGAKLPPSTTQKAPATRRN